MQGVPKAPHLLPKLLWVSSWLFQTPLRLQLCGVHLPPWVPTQLSLEWQANEPNTIHVSHL